MRITALLLTVFLCIGCNRLTQKNAPQLFTVKDSHGKVFYNMEITSCYDGYIYCKDAQEKRYIFSGNFTAIELKIPKPEEEIEDYYRSNQ